jgi:hypothetical protein
MSEQVIRNSVRKIISEQKAMKAQRDYLTEGMRLVALYQIAEKKLGNAKSSKLISEAVVSGKDPFKMDVPGVRGDSANYQKDLGLEKIEKEIDNATVWLRTRARLRNWNPGTKGETIQKLIELSEKESDKQNLYSATSYLLRIVSSAAEVEGGLSTLENIAGLNIKTIFDSIKVSPRIQKDVKEKIEDLIAAGQKPESAISNVAKTITGGLKSAAKSAASWLGLGRMGSGPEKAAGKTAGVLTPEFASKLENPKTKAAAIAELEALLGSMK